ncbi:MAG: IS110 family transposase [Opitutaceae bacterium]
MQTIVWAERKHFAALDWASDHHDVVVVDHQGTVVTALRIEHTAEGWAHLREQLRPFEPLAIAVETNQGLAVEQLLEAGYAVYPINPKSAKRYRERKAPTGVKDDWRDAWSAADALRVDGHGWRVLSPEDPLVAELRMLTRDEVALIEQRTGLTNQLQSALAAYYPAALAAFADWTCPATWAFIETFPTPAALAKAGPKRWEKFLRAHQLWREATRAKRMDCFAHASDLRGSAAAVAAKSFLAVSLAKVLRTLEQQLCAYRARIERRFGEHPDHDLFGSLPGVGPKLGPRLAAEIGSQRDRFESAEGLQAYAGTAPVTFKSGQIERHVVRRACAPFLRCAVHQWADHSRKQCAWAKAYYDKHRRDGDSHACALRCLGQRWLKILWKMWQDRTLYDEALHTRHQLEHGSWVLALQPEKTS